MKVADPTLQGEIMTVRNMLCVTLTLVAVSAVTGCRDATAPLRQVPTTARLSAQPSKGVWTVTTLDDPGTGSCTSNYCTLRDAIAAAQDGDKIVFKSSLSGTIALSEELVFFKSVTVDGGERIVLDGQSIEDRTDARVVDVFAQNVELIGLTMTNGSIEGSGGVIANSGGLTLTNTRVTGGAAEWGGGIVNSGLFLTIVRSTIADNTAATDGGGIYSAGGTLTIVASTVSGNVTLGRGGAIFNDGALHLSATTLSGNSALGGGAIYSGLFTSPNFTITSSTITNNSAMNAADGIGGIEVHSGQAQLRNTIVAGNYFTQSGIKFAHDCGGFGDFVSFGYNLFSSGCSAGSSDVTVGLAQVATEVLDTQLKDNGGPTKTHALIERGLAVDAGYCPGENADQRAFARPYDDARIANALDGCDIGAFEWQPAPTKRPK